MYSYTFDFILLKQLKQFLLHILCFVCTGQLANLLRGQYTKAVKMEVQNQLQQIYVLNLRKHANTSQQITYTAT